MRILFFPGSHTSPSARFRIWQFVEPLRQLGHSVTVRVIYPERSRGEPFWTWGLAAAAGVKHRVLAQSSRQSS